MAITKPYTFQAGTKARAGEVNQDFDILYSEVNRIGTEILNIDVDIQDILSSKADVNGNATQRFQMANPEASYDGVNKTFLENAIANIKDYISGFIISKDTDTSIIVSAGSCYDSTFTTMITSTGNITKENSAQSANATYYVYIISDATGHNVDILITTSSVNPPLPSGYTLFRRIGKYTTDGNGKISTIYSDSNTNVQSKTFVPLTLSIGVGTTSLASYLPTDNYQYLVFLYVNYNNYGTACWISSDICERFCIAHTDYDSGRATNAGGQGVIPVGEGRTITCQGVGATIRGYIRI